MTQTIERKISAALILFALLSITLPNTHAQKSRVQRVQFPRGKTSIVLRGVLRGKADMTYVVRARRGQRLTTNLTVENNCCASVLIKGPDGTNQVNEDGTDAGEASNIVLERTGDYRIIVFPPDTAYRSDIARYTLEIRVE